MHILVAVPKSKLEVPRILEGLGSKGWIKCHASPYSQASVHTLLSNCSFEYLASFIPWRLCANLRTSDVLNTERGRITPIIPYDTRNAENFTRSTRRLAEANGIRGGIENGRQPSQIFRLGQRTRSEE